MNFLAWYNLIFIIPLVSGVVLIIGNMAGFGADTDTDADHDVGGDGSVGVDVGHDADTDADADHDHGESRLVMSVLSAFGIGKVPLTVVLMMLFLLFGGIGMMSNFLIAGLIRTFEPFAFVSVAAGFFGAIFLSGSLARLLNRYMPSTETYADSKAQMVGKTGTLELSANEECGWAQVRDSRGSIRQIKCRTREGSLTKGTEVVVDYDEHDDLYTVAENKL